MHTAMRLEENERGMHICRTSTTKREGAHFNPPVRKKIQEHTHTHISCNTGMLSIRAV